jgi:hypothetical protein
MEVSKLIFEYLRVLAWPTVAVALSLMFRDEVKTLFARMTRAELPGGVSVDFPREVREAKELSARVEATPAPPDRRRAPGIPLTEANARLIQLGLRPSPSGLDMNYYGAFAAQDPNVALAELRIELDVLARNLAKGFNVNVDTKDTGSRLIRKLYDGGAVTAEQMQLTLKVLQLCNAAVHGTPVTQEQAEAVIDTVDVLAAQYVSWLSWGFEDGWKPAGARGGQATGQDGS